MASIIFFYVGIYIDQQVQNDGAIEMITISFVLLIFTFQHLIFSGI